MLNREYVLNESLVFSISINFILIVTIAGETENVSTPIYDLRQRQKIIAFTKFKIKLGTVTDLLNLLKAISLNV